MSRVCFGVHLIMLNLSSLFQRGIYKDLLLVLEAVNSLIGPDTDDIGRAVTRTREVEG